MAEVFVRWSFETSAFAGAEFVVVGAHIREGLDRPYEARVEVLHPDADADIASCLGKDCSLGITRGDNTRTLRGLVRTVTEVERTAHAELRISLEIVPAFFMLSLRTNTQIFQEMTVPDILESVLGEGLGAYSREVEVDLRAEYPVREYCVQYQETDLQFCERLMQEEGISYSFDHEGEKEVLVLRDSNAAMTEVPSGAAIPFRPVGAALLDVEPVLDLRVVRRATTTSVVVRDWDWTRAGAMPFDAEDRGTDEMERDRESYEQGAGRSLSLTDYASPSYGAEDSTRQASLRRQELVRDAVRATGRSRVIQLAPGTLFELTDHPVVGVDGRYLVTSVQHRSEPPGDEPGEAGDRYVNDFECVPASTEYRPRRRFSKPTIASIQTAVVTGPSGEEIYVDEHGRVKVQFFWDRAQVDGEKRSCWVRVEQPWAGAGWGFWFVPRIGMEVVVHFIDGDPDRPLVSGCVYNGANALPYPLPDEKTKSTIRTNSSPGGGGYNELRFEDKAGEEEIFTHAQKNYDEVVENDHTTLVHNDQSNTVDVDQTQTVHGNQTEQIDVDQTMTVDADRTVTVSGDYSETVDGTETRLVGGDVDETFGATETRTVSGNLTESISGNESRTVGAAQTETIGGSHALTVSGSMTHTITGALTRLVTGGVTQTTSGAFSSTATGGYTVIAPGGVTLDAAGGVELAAPGGVVHIDSEKSWLGAWKYDGGGNSQAMSNVKTEAIARVHAIAAAKFEFAPIFIESYGTRIKTTSGSGIRNGVAYCFNGGIKAETGPESKT